MMRESLKTVILLVAAMVSGYFGGVMSQTTGQAAESKTPAPKVVRAQKFEIVDSAGKVRGHFGIADEMLEIVMRDAEGNCRLSQSVFSDGSPDVSLFDSAGILRLTQEIVSDGSLYLTLFDSEGSTRLIQTVDQTGTPDISLLDSKEKVLWRAPAGSK